VSHPPRPLPGPHNDLTDVAGVDVGHYQRRGRGWLTGTTVVLPPPGTVGSVDIGGGAPGTRETEALDPNNLVERVDAVCRTGGSAYGLAAADGVTRWLADRNRGFQVGPEPHHVVPIVPAAVLFDLGMGGRFQNTPDARFGERAATAARPKKFAQGTVGAGTGAHAERLKGGIGSASVVLSGGITVAALVALNSSGHVFDVRNGELLAIGRGIADEFAHLRTPSRKDVAAHHADPPALRPLNTTLAVVATDATLSKTECARMAISGQDGLARAIDPVHQYVDGDVVFTLATGARPVPDAGGDPAAFSTGAPRPLQLNAIFAAGADTVARAIVHAAVSATSAGGLTSYLDRFPSARNHYARRHA
jgi:L-aminopeptidase/D-esterase-like protein